MLLFGARRQVGDQAIFLRGGGDDFSVAGIHNHGFRGLGAAVNAEDEGSHGWSGFGNRPGEWPGEGGNASQFLGEWISHEATERMEGEWGASRVETAVTPLR